MSTYNAQYYARNRERILARNRRWESENRERRNQYAREYYKDNAARIREAARKRRFERIYGTTVEAIEALRLVQNNLCAICSRSFDEHEMHVDHSHATGDVRGLLCENCNLGIGQFNDSPERLAAALDYLTANGGAKTPRSN